MVGQPETRNFLPSAVKTQLNHVSGRKRLARTVAHLLSYVPMMVDPQIKTVCNLCGPASILGMSSSNRQRGSTIRRALCAQEAPTTPPTSQPTGPARVATGGMRRVRHFKVVQPILVVQNVVGMEGLVISILIMSALTLDYHIHHGGVWIWDRRFVLQDNEL